MNIKLNLKETEQVIDRIDKCAKHLTCLQIFSHVSLQTRLQVRFDIDNSILMNINHQVQHHILAEK